jgi:hypothetical protein
VYKLRQKIEDTEYWMWECHYDATNNWAVTQYKITIVGLGFVCAG